MMLHLLQSLSLLFLQIPPLRVPGNSYIDFSKDEDDSRIFGAMGSLEITDFSDTCVNCLSFVLDNFPVHGSPRLQETSQSE
jgi:hypothetical protein